MEKEPKKCRWFEREPEHTSIMRIIAAFTAVCGGITVCVGLILFWISFFKEQIDYVSMMKYVSEDYEYSISELLKVFKMTKVKTSELIQLIGLGFGQFGVALAAKVGQSFSEARKVGGDDNR